MMRRGLPKDSMEMRKGMTWSDLEVASATSDLVELRSKRSKEGLGEARVRSESDLDVRTGLDELEADELPEGVGETTATEEDLSQIVRDLKEEKAERGGARVFWARPSHFFFTALSSVLGVSGLFFWPAQLIEYGAVFALASWVLLLSVHLPLVCLEVGLGQFSCYGPLHVWRKVLPVLEAVGWVQLLFGLFYGQAHCFHSARMLYYWTTIISGSGGSTCIDSAREPASLNSAHCTSSWAFRECDEEGRRYERQHSRSPGAHPFWLAQDRCHDRRGVAHVYIPRLEACWAKAAEGRPVDKVFCALNLHLFFNATAPIDFFRLRGVSDVAQTLLHNGSRQGLDCVGGLFKEKKPCRAGLQQPEPELDWGRRLALLEESLTSVKQRELVIDLRGWEGRENETRGRAACLHRLLSLMRIDARTCRRALEAESEVKPRQVDNKDRRPKRGASGQQKQQAYGELEEWDSRMACLLRLYCGETFGAEVGEMECYRRVLVPVPSFSSSEKVRRVYTYEGPHWHFSGYVLVGLGLCGPVLLWLGWGGVRRMGQIAFATRTLPLLFISAHCAYVIFQREHFATLSWTFRWELCRLLEPGLWVRASVANFLVLGLGKGILMSLASYNRFHQDGVRDAVFLGLGSWIICVGLGGVEVAVLGALFVRQGLSPEHLRTLGLSSSSLTPQALDEVPFIFPFLATPSLILFLLTTAASMVLALGTAVADEREGLRQRWGLVVSVATAAVLLPALAYVRNDGNALLGKHMFFLEAVLSPATQLLLVLSLAYVYGADRLLRDFRLMVDGEAEYLKESTLAIGRVFLRGWGRHYLQLSWMAVTPAALVGLTVAGVAESGVGLAWSLGFPLALLLLFPLSICYSRCRRKIKWLNLVRPQLDWGPMRAADRRGRYALQALMVAALFGRGHKDRRPRSPDRSDPSAQSASAAQPSPSSLRHLPLPDGPLEDHSVATLSLSLDFDSTH